MLRLLILTLCVAAVFSAPPSKPLAGNVYSVTGLVRNEFSYDLTLKISSLSIGTWTTPPPTTIPSGNQYVPIFAASGADGVVGTVDYVVTNAPNPDNPPRASFYFMNEQGNQTYTTKACCSPFIGGVGTKSGDAYSVQYQFWTHQMCLGDSCKKKE